MPKKMFYNITDDKRNRFLEESIKQFSTYPFKDVSISSICKALNISRGTFYNYFDSTGELLEYIIDLIKEKRHIYAKQILQNSNYDIFLFVINLFEYDFDEFLETSRYSLLRNYIHYLRDSNQSFQEKFLKKVLTPLLDFNEFKLYDSNKYKVNEETFYKAIEMIGTILSENLYLSEHFNISKEETFDNIKTQISIIVSGLKHFEMIK
jgi:AcrR family transcriptional regulator